MAAKNDEEYEQFLKALGKRIRELRLARGWSQRDMVVLHGYNDSQWRKYERGGGMTLQSLVSISKIFNECLTIVLDGVGLSFPGVVPSSPVKVEIKLAKKGPGRPKVIKN